MAIDFTVKDIKHKTVTKQDRSPDLSHRRVLRKSGAYNPVYYEPEGFYMEEIAVPGYSGLPVSHRKLLFFYLCIAVSANLANAQGRPRHDSPFAGGDLFVEASFFNYFTPPGFDNVIETEPGFRGALGYELNRFRFALESGFTHVKGTNPFVLDISLVPLAFKAGYSLPLLWGLGFRADISAGLMFSRAVHYETAVKMLTDNLAVDDTQSFFAGGRLYLTWAFPGQRLKLYAGGGVDIIPETKGPIPLPALEIGVSFKLFTVKPAEPEEYDEPEAEEIAPFVFETVFVAVYFPPDGTIPFYQYLSVLNEAGRLLLENDELCIVLRGYCAPAGTEAGRLSVSRERAEFCRDYLALKFGIEDERMSVEYYGSAETPVDADGTWETQRCVDLIVYLPQ